jgi:hypothetical protein
MKPTRSAKTRRVPQHPGFDANALVAAAKEAVRQALARHKTRGNAVVVWRDGRVVLLRPEDIEI